LSPLEEWYIGIDLGGTAIKLAIVTEQGEIKYKAEEATPVSEGGDQALYKMNQMIEKGLIALQLKRQHVKGIGIGAPAFLDLEKGFVYSAVNLGWKDYALKDRLEEITKLPVIVDNDANAAALGEMWQGAGQGATNLLCITLGTGVGGGVIIHGQIYHGARGTSGEIGHYTVLAEEGYQCNCGKTGCLETIASATGIVRIAMDALAEEKRNPSTLAQVLSENGRIEAKDVTNCAQEGDILSQHVLNQVGYYLGIALGNYAIVMNPEKIVIGGGVSKAGEVLFKPIREYYDKYALPLFTGRIEIVPASLGNDAGVIGAAWLVHSK
jgi:glucokinase